MKKVFLFFAVAAVFAACAPKQAAEQTEAVDSVATATVDSAATVVDSAAAVVDSAATEVAK